jgi:glycerol-3-phosphate acyltransferase PlsY
LSHITSLLLVLAGYLLGSIPPAYLLGRWARGIDLREYGSGSLGGSNVLEHVGRWAFAVVGVVDVGKGALPAAAGLWLGLGRPTAVVAGLAAVIGHNWSLYLRFSGGRGIAPAGGMLVVVAPREVLVLLPVFLLGALLDQGPVTTLVLALALPVIAWLLGEPAGLVAGLAGITATVILKRLLGNTGWAAVPAGQRRSVFINRLLYDRDIRDARLWMQRRPPADG